jgi:hypothetical protein
MQSKGSTPAELSKLIEKKSSLVDKDCRKDFKDKIYKYAGLK